MRKKTGIVHCKDYIPLDAKNVVNSAKQNISSQVDIEFLDFIVKNKLPIANSQLDMLKNKTYK